jgi:hypothetical protein
MTAAGDLIVAVLGGNKEDVQSLLETSGMAISNDFKRLAFENAVRKGYQEIMALFDERYLPTDEALTTKLCDIIESIKPQFAGKIAFNDQNSIDSLVSSLRNTGGQLPAFVNAVFNFYKALTSESRLTFTKILNDNIEDRRDVSFLRDIMIGSYFLSYGNDMSTNLNHTFNQEIAAQRTPVNFANQGFSAPPAVRSAEMSNVRESAEEHEHTTNARRNEGVILSV